MGLTRWFGDRGAAAGYGRGRPASPAGPRGDAVRPDGIEAKRAIDCDLVCGKERRIPLGVEELRLFVSWSSIWEQPLRERRRRLR